MKIYKTISWSIIALLITVGVGYLITGSIIKGGAIGLIARALKIPTYWLHETIYEKIKPKTDCDCIN
jgi:uncharacterized membrane protein